MAKRWVESGHKVSIITSTAKFGAGFELNEKINRIQLDGINVIAVDVKYNNKYGFIRRLWSFARFAFKCLAVAKTVKNVDVVLGSSTPLTISIPAVVCARRFKCPMVFEVRDLWPEMPIAVGALRNPLLKLLARQLEKFSYKHSDRIIALSPGMASGIVALGYPERKVTVVPNTSDVTRFRDSSVSSERFLRKFPFLRDKQIVLYAGTIGKLNGVDYLAEIASELKSSKPDIAFVVIGAGAREDVVERVARRSGVLNDNFFMLGQMPKENIPDAFAASSICCSLFINIPEMNKNSANKFFDALAAERAILINYKGWQARIIEQNGIGLIIPPKDPQEAARRIYDLLGDPKRMMNFSTAAGKIGVERFGIDSLSARVLDVLEMSIKVKGEKPLPLPYH